MQSKARYTVGFAMLIVCALVFGILNLISGSSSVTLPVVLDVLAGHNIRFQYTESLWESQRFYPLVSRHAP